MTARSLWIIILALAVPLVLAACGFQFQRQPQNQLEAARPTTPPLGWTPAPTVTPFPFKSLVGGLLQNTSEASLTPPPTVAPGQASAATATAVWNWPTSVATPGTFQGPSEVKTPIATPTYVPFGGEPSGPTFFVTAPEASPTPTARATVANTATPTVKATRTPTPTPKKRRYGGGGGGGGGGGSSSSAATSTPAPTATPTPPGSPTSTPTPTLIVSVDTAQGNVGQTVPVDIVLELVSNGISGFVFDLTMQNPAMAQIQSITLPAFGFPLVTGTPGPTVRVIVADVNEILQGQIASVVIATANIELLATGTSQLDLTLNQLDSDTGGTDLVPFTTIGPGAITVN